MTTAGIHRIHLETPAIEIEGARARVDGLLIDDPDAVGLLATASPEDRPELLHRIIAVGARGLTTMGVGIDIAAIDARVQRVVGAATDEAQRTITAILDNARTSLAEQFDPEQRSSILSRALADFSTWRDGFVADLDPGIDGSTATQLLDRLQRLVGEDGALDTRLSEALDLDADGSALARLAAGMEAGFAELRRDLARAQGTDDGRAAEAERGTAHGLVFEDVVEAAVRRWAMGRPGTIVERTSGATGSLDARSLVGDLVVTLPTGARIVVEAKRQARITLTGPSGILTELDRAATNRQADAAVCISGRDAFPAEVGHFNVYGDRVLAVDEGDGAMTAVAMQWAAASLATRADGGAALDAGAVADRVDRIRKAAESLKGARQSVTTIRGSLEGLYELLGTLRGDLLDQVDDLARMLSLRESRGTGDPRP